MSVKQFPEPGAEKKYPFGANGSFTFDTTLNSGVYEVNVTGDDSYAESDNALTVTSPDGYVIPVHLDTGEGVVALPFDDNDTINAASISTPTIASFSKVKYEQGVEPSGISVSFDSGYSGSYIVDMTIPVDATEAYIYYDNGVKETLGTSFPASVSSPTFDTTAAFNSGSVNFGYVYADSKSILSRGVSSAETYPTPAGAFATGGTIFTSGGYRYHLFTSNGTLDFVAGGDIDYVVVAGGGGGSSQNNGRSSGGGGAGGFLSGSISVTSGSIAVTVGAGGSGGTTGVDGNDSSLAASVVSDGGGRGGRYNAVHGGDGGSGGGGANTANPGSGVAGPPRQGYDGGTGGVTTAGGGGGAAEAGNTDGAGYGGDGVNSASAWATVTSTGDSGFYAGGGGGGDGTGGAVKPGGDGGGGDGGGGLYGSIAAQSGTANTGGGGGGGSNQGGAAAGGASGGSGIVMIRYLL